MEKFWFVFGLVAQGIFFMRFVVQWISSEKNKKSVIPISFWYLSLFGGLGLPAYAIHVKDPVFILGQAVGSVVYVRNLMMIKAERRAENTSRGE